MSADSATTGTTDQGTGTGTAPAPQGTGTAQAPATGNAQGKPDNGNTPGQAPNGPADSEPLTKAMADLAKANDRIKALEQAAMTDQERKDARLAELEAERSAWEMERQTLVLRHEAFQAAATAGAMYPDLVVQAISPAVVEWSKDGKPTNLAKVVADVRQAYPALFRVAPGQSDGGAGQGAPTQPTMNDLIRRQAGR
jgi:hypothetical protein